MFLKKAFKIKDKNLWRAIQLNKFFKYGLLQIILISI